MIPNKDSLMHLTVLCGFLLTLGLIPSINAAGTASGTKVSNFATVNYKVGGETQDAVESTDPDNVGDATGVGNGETTNFLVDTIVDLTVATKDSAAVQITPGGTSVLSFTVKNTGNNTQDYKLDAIAVQTGGSAKFGGTDNLDFTSTDISIFVDSDGNNEYTPGVDTATFINDLGPDVESARIFIVAAANGNFNNGDIASYDLLATTFLSTDNGSFTGGNRLNPAAESAQGADDTNLVEFVLADEATTATGTADGNGTAVGTETDITDAQKDGQHSNRSDFLIKSAALTVEKTSVVVSDPINMTTNPKRIPGAIIEYRIRVQNSGNVDATELSVSDDISGDVTAGFILPVNSTNNDEADYSGETAGGIANSVSPPQGVQILFQGFNIAAGTNVAYSTDADDVENIGATNVSGKYASNVISVSNLTVAGGSNVEVRFRVKINDSN